MIRVALAGQPNCGKSTIFNLVSGIKQHIANYPGVTVDKKVGRFDYEGEKIEMVDLPGTYSFSSYSLEERVAKDFIIDGKPDLIVNVVDASNIKRNLYFTFQLLEIGVPVVVVLNMMDVAERRGVQIDVEKISQMLGCKVVAASGAKGIGGEEIMKAIVHTAKNAKSYEEFKINYEELEPSIRTIQEKIKHDEGSISHRWLAIKVLEGDKGIADRLKDDSIEEASKKEETTFHSKYDRDIPAFLASLRYDSADIVCHKAIKETKKGKQTATDKIDSFILNRWLAIPFLLFIMFLIYQLSIVYGYKITDYTWPILAAFKNFTIGIMPEADFIDVPLITGFSIWMVNSANALLNYLPIFFILFALIAIMEDVGYMPRMAFILDRVFRRFGLHGQSTLPLVLGGAVVGGCAVPGVMATKGIADDRARMATILTVPYMNCLAKVPFYTLLLGAFFKAEMALMMFYISTVTIFIALIVAKIMTSTVLRTRETAPFVMELPPYHTPTFKGVIISALQRLWVYIYKVFTIVLLVAVILFVMLQLPGLSNESKMKYENEMSESIDKFKSKVEKSKYFEAVDERGEISELLNFHDNFRAKRMSATSKEASAKVNAEFKEKNSLFFTFVRPMGDKDAKIVNRSLRKLARDRNRVLRNMKNEKIENSILGKAGRSIEPVTQYAGFDWKINVAFLSSFAARESAVATIGSLYEDRQMDSQRPEEAMAEHSGYTPLHAVAIIIFMIFSPPCIATMIVVKMQANGYRWMIFATFFPVFLGVAVSSFIFTVGSMHNITGVEGMAYFYFTVVGIALVLGLFPSKLINWRGGFTKT